MAAGSLSLLARRPSRFKGPGYSFRAPIRRAVETISNVAALSPRSDADTMSFFAKDFWDFPGHLLRIAPNRVMVEGVMSCSGYV